MPNQPIKNIQLKNGNKYPVGEAWREPITPGRDMDFEIAYDPEATGYGTISLGYYMTASGAESITTLETQQLWPIKVDGENIGTLTQEEISHASLFANIPTLGDMVMGDAIIMTTDAVAMYYASLAAEEMSSQMDTEITIDSGESYDGFPGLWGLTAGAGAGIGLCSFSEAVSTTYQEITLGSGAITLRATLEIPAAGAYWTSTKLAATLAQMNFSAILSICDWHIDDRFLNSGIIRINNGFFSEQLWNNRGFVLTMAPAILQKFQFAALNNQAIMMPSIWGIPQGYGYDGEWECIKLNHTPHTTFTLTYGFNDTLTVSTSE